MSGKVDVKVVLLGNSLSGKTCLMHRYLNNKFLTVTQSTVGAAFGAKSVVVNGRSVTLGIWDTAGSERYEAMSKFYYRDASAAVVCFDLTDRKAWEKVKFWVNELLVHEPQCSIVLCGTKEDLLSEEHAERGVDVHTITKYCAEINAQYFETSSKTGKDVEAAFRCIADNYVRQTPLNRPSATGVCKIKHTSLFKLTS